MEAAVNPSALHAPKIGPVARMLGPLRFSGVFWYRFALWGTNIFPNWAKPPFVWAIAMFFFMVLAGVRRAISANLRAVLGPCGALEEARRAHRTFQIFAWCLLERHERLGSNIPFALQSENLEVWRRAIAAYPGFICLSGHIGNFEIGYMVPELEGTRRLHIVREEEIESASQAHLARVLHEKTSDRCVTHFASHDIKLGIDLLEALKRGEVVALLGDRPRKGGRTISVRLFGRAFPLPEGPFVLARLSGVPIMPVFAVRSGRRQYCVRFREPIIVDQALGREEAISIAASRFAEGLEDTLRRDPYQWFCFGNLWKEES